LHIYTIQLPKKLCKLKNHI